MLGGGFMTIFLKRLIWFGIALLMLTGNFSCSGISTTTHAKLATPQLDGTPPPTEAATTPATLEERPDFAPYFQAFNVVGSFELFDLNANKYIRYNPERTTQGFIPASTFKIFNSLVGLETGVVTD